MDLSEKARTKHSVLSKVSLWLHKGEHFDFALNPAKVVLLLTYLRVTLVFFVDKSTRSLEAPITLAASCLSVCHYILLYSSPYSRIVLPVGSHIPNITSNVHF